MVKANGILVVDLGNSSTKCKVLFGKDSVSGRYRERKFELSNTFAEVPENYNVPYDYSDADSTILHVDDEIAGMRVKGNFCNGELQSREFTRNATSPSAQRQKYELLTSALSYRLALLYAYKQIMAMQHITDYGQLDITWTVVTMLPPGSIDAGMGKLIEMVQSITTLDVVFPQVKIPISITKVAVLPEGFCAYAGVVFDSGRVIRQEYKNLMKETVLVIDIGAGTTDILVIRDNKLVQDSKYTIEQGGNNVYQLVRRTFMKEGKRIDSEDVKRGVVTGFVKDGSTWVSIVDRINDAKREVAAGIVQEIQNFLDATDIKARSVGYLIVCGGGSMRGEVPEILKIGDFLIESFKNLSPNSQLVDLPKQYVQVETLEGNIEKGWEEISPRELNLYGAAILAEGM